MPPPALPALAALVTTLLTAVVARDAGAGRSGHVNSTRVPDALGSPLSLPIKIRFDTTTCGGTKSDRSGGFWFWHPDGLPKGLYCTWYFTYPYAIRFRFTLEGNELDRNCKQALLFSAGDQFEKMLVSPARSKRSMVCSAGGRKLPEVIEVEGREAVVSLVAFSRGSEKTRDGFTLHYEAIEAPPPPAPPAACSSLPESSHGRAACDGQWIVLQSRTIGDVPFDQTWDAYRQGFGFVGGDHWLGLDALYTLCPTTRPCELRVEITYFGEPYYLLVTKQPSGRYTAVYRRFAVAGPEQNFRLDIGQWLEDSTAPDSISGYYLNTQNGMEFSTIDVDNDLKVGGSCSAMTGHGGWWYRNCGFAWLNGYWDSSPYDGLYWSSVTGGNTAASSRMLVRVGA